MAVKIILIINVQGAAMKLAYCLTRRALEGYRPACTNFVVRLPWLSSVCFVPLPPSLFPSCLPL